MFNPLAARFAAAERLFDEEKVTRLFAKIQDLNDSAVA
jgi:hypothetical protein